jgi:3alpha(or 20beta)-hydroxysteroid dehydrogenase
LGQSDATVDQNGEADVHALNEHGGPTIDLTGRVAIVTGAAQGQGAAEARHFRNLGAQVIMADISDEKGESLASEIGATYRHTDVASAPAWEALMAAVLAAHGRLDILVNNAAVHWMRLIEDESIEEFDRLIGVNLRGTFLGIKSSIAPMRASGGGSIVNIASIAGVRGFQQHGSYGASKWAIRGLTKTAAAELGPSGIRVNAVVPGTINTPMAWGGGEMPEGVSFDHLPLGRVGEAGDIAAMVAFLASDAAGYITGAEVVIDGGATLGIVRRGGDRI